MTHQPCRSPVFAVLALVLGFILLVSTAFAAELPPQDLKRLSWMEEALFAASYGQEPPEQRLSRLEQDVLGVAFDDDSADQRLKRLHEALMARRNVTTIDTSVKGRQPVKNGQQPNAMMQDDSSPSTNALETSDRGGANQLHPEESDYPVVDAMEAKVFGESYTDEHIDGRLGRLDNRIFGQPQSGAYSARVDNLRTIVLGNAAVSNSSGYGKLNQTDRIPPQHHPFPRIPPQSNPLNPQRQSRTSASAQPSPSGIAGENLRRVTVFDPFTDYSDAAQRADMARAVTQMEKDMLSATYDNETIESRLARLEQTVFNNVAPPGASNQDRIDRLIAVASVESSQPENPVTKKSMMKTVLPFLPIILLMLL